MWSFELLNYDFRHLLVVLMAAALFSSVVACSEDSKSPPPGGGGTPTQDKSAGSFESLSGEVMDFNMDECKSPQTFKFDERIKAKDIYETKKSYLTTENTYSVISEKETVQSVDPKEGQLSTRSELVLNGVAGWSEKDCVYNPTEDGGFVPECSNTQLSESLQTDSAAGDEEINAAACVVYMDSPEDVDDRKMERGIYTFANKKKVQAYRVTTEATGIVLCSNGNSDFVEKGLGKKVSVSIVSAEIPEVFTKVTCGAPAEIFFYEQITLQDGTVKSANSLELVSMDQVENESTAKVGP